MDGTNLLTCASERHLSSSQRNLAFFARKLNSPISLARSRFSFCLNGNPIKALRTSIDSTRHGREGGRFTSFLWIITTSRRSTYWTKKNALEWVGTIPHLFMLYRGSRHLMCKCSAIFYCWKQHTNESWTGKAATAVLFMASISLA